MAEDVVIGIAIFIALVLLAMAGRTAGFKHADIWS